MKGVENEKDIDLMGHDYEAFARKGRAWEKAEWIDDQRGSSVSCQRKGYHQRFSYPQGSYLEPRLEYQSKSTRRDVPTNHYDHLNLA